MARCADARAESVLESALRAILVQARITGFDLQVQIDEDGFRARVDLGDHRRRIVLEADSFAQLGVLMNANTGNGTKALLNQFVAVNGATSAMHADFDSYSASNTLAELYRAQARRARIEQHKAALRAAVLKRRRRGRAGSTGRRRLDRDEARRAHP